MRPKLLLFVLIIVFVAVAGIAVRLIVSLYHKDETSQVAVNEDKNSDSSQNLKSGHRTLSRGYKPQTSLKDLKVSTVSKPAAITDLDRSEGAYEDEAYKNKWEPLIERMRAAMDDDNSEMAMVDARQLMTAPNPLARRAALDLFRWVGAKALPEISRMLADPKSDIAQAAYESWETVFDEISNHKENITSTVQAILRVNDEDVRNGMLLKITSLPEETAADYLRALLDVPNREVADLALEYVSFMAQETMQNKSEAIKWIAGLKNVSN